jgi:hypothetical protein
VHYDELKKLEIEFKRISKKADEAVERVEVAAEEMAEVAENTSR